MVVWIKKLVVDLVSIWSYTLKQIKITIPIPIYKGVMYMKNIQTMHKDGKNLLEVIKKNLK